MKIQYENYTFIHNPYTVFIDKTANYLTYFFPYQGEKAVILGDKKDCIRLKGQFTGPDCESDYAAFQNVYKTVSQGILRLSPTESVSVYFTNLKSEQKANPHVIEYEAEFVEC